LPPDEPQAADAASAAALRPAPESLLAVDIGSAFTKAALFEPVEGQYRLIARGQARTDLDAHIYETLARAFEPIEVLTGRRLSNAGEPLAGDVGGGRGVEVLSASLSSYLPLRVLASNGRAAEAARNERCLVDVVPPGSLADKVARLAGGAWDAIVGEPAEVQEALQCLGRGESDHQTSGPVAISGDAEGIRSQLAGLALKFAEARVPGLPELASCATEPLATATSAVLRLARLIAARFGLRLGIVDCGATHTSLCYATPEAASARAIARAQPLTDLPVTAQRISAFHQDLQETLTSCVDGGFSADLLVGTGALSHFGRWSELALTLLNGIRPEGVIQFALDSAGIVGQVASLAGSYPDIACTIFEQDGLLGLGAAICPRGTLKPGMKALEVRWQVNGDIEQTRDVKFGELITLPLPSGRKANLALYPAKQIDVGLNRPGTAATAHVDGGRVGLMVDARDPAQKAQRGSWLQALE
jgi:hypothetical protein